jgi:bifunctional DNase/RNase
VGEVELSVVGIRESDEERLLIVCLREKHGKRRGNVTVGEESGAAITFAARGIHPDPPQAYDAWADSLVQAHIGLEQYLINALIGTGEDRRVSGILCLAGGGTWKFTVPCGASEGINLALRMRAPIRISEEILKFMDEQANAVRIGTEREWREQFLGIDPTATKH